jgi:hypothetical protein
MVLDGVVWHKRFPITTIYAKDLPVSLIKTSARSGNVVCCEEPCVNETRSRKSIDEECQQTAGQALCDNPLPESVALGDFIVSFC